MKKRTLIILLAVLAILVGVLFLVTKLSNREADTSAETTAEEDTAALYSVDASGITAISWSWNGTGTSLVYSLGAWSFTGDRDAQLDQDTCAALATTLSGLTASQTVTEDLSLLSQFQLDQPSLQISFTAVGQEITLAVGMKNPTLGQYYALYNGVVYLLDSDVYTPFAVSPYSLLAAQNAPAISASDVTGLTLSGPDAALVLYKPEDPAALSYSDDYVWFSGNTALNTTACNTLANLVLNLDLSLCTGQSQPDENAYCVSLDYDNADLGAGCYTVYFTLPDTQAVSLDASEDVGEDPAKVWSGGLCYAVEAAKLRQLVQTSLPELLPDDICAMDLTELKALVFTLDGVDYRFDVLPVTTTAEDGTESITYSYSLNGSAVEQSQVQSLWGLLTGLNVEGTVEASDLPTADAALTVKLYRDRETYSVMSLNLISYDQSFYVVDFAGSQRLLVSFRDVDALCEALLTFS